MAAMLRKLFGLGAGKGADKQEETTDADAAIGARETYKAFELQAAPKREGKTWRVAGHVVNNDASDAAPQAFVRADTYMDYDDAVAVSLRKARQIVDEQEALGHTGGTSTRQP